MTPEEQHDALLRMLHDHGGGLEMKIRKVAREIVEYPEVFAGGVLVPWTRNHRTPGRGFLETHVQLNKAFELHPDEAILVAERIIRDVLRAPDFPLPTAHPTAHETPESQ